jgi:hypothetical protein
MVDFRISRDIKVVAKYGKSSNGFNHFATLYLKGREMDTVKTHYINRTWESYEFDSVIQKLADNSPNLTPIQRKDILDWVKNRDGHDDEGMKRLGSIGALAMMGDVLGSNQKEKNSLKTTALKSVRGIDLPDDWNTLSEAEKERRLNGAIGVLNKKM